MSRQLIVCCDGTCNEITGDSTNVLRLYRMLSRDQNQLAYYDSGVGTLVDLRALTAWGRYWSKRLDAAIGQTIRDNWVEAYRFLASNYTPGDEIYLFGFSRGAYTVRALAGAIHMCGLPRPELAGQAALAWNIYSNDDDHLPATARFRGGNRFRSYFGVEARTPIHFVGVWDTVSSFGWFNNYRTLPYTFHNPSIEYVRHAVSIDERRALFRENLFKAPELPSPAFKQVWFAGVHCDVGGGYPEEDDVLARHALRWMAREAAAAGLRFDEDRRAELSGSDDTGRPPTVHDSLEGWWRLIEFLPRRRFDENSKRMRLRLWPQYGQPRKIKSKPTIHRSVADLLGSKTGNYRPPNLPPDYEVED